MTTFTKVTLCLALLTLTGLASRTKCESRILQFFNKCLSKGYEPKILENCEVSGDAGAPKAVRKCRRMEKVLTAQCDYQCYGPYYNVPYEVARAAFLPTDATTSRGNTELHCEGDRNIGDRIFWTKNGVRVNSQTIDDQYEPNVWSIYTVVDDDEAYYSCNGVGLYLLQEQPKVVRQETSVWQGSTIVCIDKVASEETSAIQRMDGLYKTSIFLFAKRQVPPVPLYPIKQRKVVDDMTIQCNNTEAYTFTTESRPETSVKFKGKDVFCFSTDAQGRCQLKIYIGDEEVASGLSPVIKHTYAHLREIVFGIVRCTADCEI